MLKLIRKHQRRLIFGLAILVALNLWVLGLGRNDVLDTAYSFPDDDGYCSLKDTGVNQTISYNGSIILPASKGGSYCCGFTFEVAMKVAEARGLLAGKTVAQIRRFQEEWYGSTDETAMKECAAAVVDLGVGREISMAEARPGDFVTFQRIHAPGHSVVFLEWIRNDAQKIIGIHYRSSQPPHGIEDRIEYFANDSMPLESASIDPHHLFVARLNRPWWSRLLYPMRP